MQQAVLSISIGYLTAGAWITTQCVTNLKYMASKDIKWLKFSVCDVCFYGRFWGWKSIAQASNLHNKCTVIQLVITQIITVVFLCLRQKKKHAYFHVAREVDVMDVFVTLKEQKGS